MDLDFDGVYCWPDYHAAYVEKYNIRLPEAFRKHILDNYESRKRLHLLLRLVDRIEIRNNPYLGYRFQADIFRSGTVIYQSNTDCPDGMKLTISKEDARYIIDPGMTESFCYDDPQFGKPLIDGYHWEIVFYIRDRIIKHLEGWPGESVPHYLRMRRVFEFIERYLPGSLGTQYMRTD